MSLGERIVLLIEQADITQRELAKTIKVSPSALNNYLKDYRNPDYSVLIAIADYFSVSTDYLLGRNCCNNELVITGLTEREKKIISENAKALIKNR